MKVQIKDIELVFSENQQQFIDKIKMTIQNNYELILSCLGENKTIDISQDESNFNDTFYYIVKGTYNDASIRRLLYDKFFLLKLYIEVLIRRKNYSNISIDHNPNITDELLSSLIAYKYFETNGSFDDFVEYLKVRNTEETIFEWLKINQRWETYNYLLNIALNGLKEEDDDFLTHVTYIISYYSKKALECNKKEKAPKVDYPDISDIEFDRLFYEFLNFINAPDSWIDIYNSLKEQKLLIREHGVTECFQDEDGIYKIKLENSNDLFVFCNFVHEFIHYISMKDGFLKTEKLIEEFTSIFFQKIAAEFLTIKGYPNVIIDIIDDDRDSNNYYIVTFPLFFRIYADLIYYFKNGKIEKENMMATLQSFFDDESKPSRTDLEKRADDYCDFLIDFFIEEGLLFGYQYLFDTYLAEQVLNKREQDNTIIKKMINVTNNLGMTSVKDILTLFGIENTLQEEAAKKIIKK